MAVPAQMRQFDFDQSLSILIWTLANAYCVGSGTPYAWFTERGGLTRENGRRLREMILSRGGTADAAELYRAFRGRDPVVEPLLVKRGLIHEPGGA